MELDGNLSLSNDSDVFNMTLEEFLIYARGPKQLPLVIAIPITIVYVLIFVTGVVGNVAVCVVIVKHSSMHTATNYYLFSLAVSDLTLLLLGLPYDLSVYWHQYPWSLGVTFCKIRALISETSSYVSVLTIVAFSMERYLAICHPLHLYTMSGLQRAVRIIAILWFVSLVSAMPFAVFTSVNYLDYPPGSGQIAIDSAFCAMLNQPQGWPVWELSSVLFFIVPMLVMMILYARMGLRIRNRTRHSLGKGVNGSVHGETRHSQSRKAIIRMLAAVVIAFFVCWAPFHAQRLLFIYGKDTPHFHAINEWMFYITGVLYYVSSTVNPILYNVMSNRYRVAFRETLCGRKRKHSSNGLYREQSSFRETMIGSTYEGTQLVRVRSVMGDRLHATHTGRFPSTRHHHNNHGTTVRRENRPPLNVQWQETIQEQKKSLDDDSKKLLNNETNEIKTNFGTTDLVVVITPAANANGKNTTTFLTTTPTVISLHSNEEDNAVVSEDLNESDEREDANHSFETCI